ncbi:MAG: hypothetical protein NTV34_19740 [Proteobacteria bacterium]|nr:hypothetical protein [Pseudomonadota bacterium]
MKKIPRLFVAQYSIVGCVLVCLAFGCGKKKKDDGSEDGGGSVALVGAAAVVGNWIGIYSALDKEGKVFGESHDAEVSFLEDGAFAIDLKDDASAKVRGLWQEFGGKNLFFMVKESTIQKIPALPSSQETAYDLTGNSIYIKGAAFELKVSRKKTESTSGGPDSMESSLTGQWYCAVNSTVTRLSIGGNYSWRGIIRDESGGLGVLEGPGHLDGPAVLALTVSSSNHQVEPDSVLLLTLKGKIASLQLKNNLGMASLGDCRRD